MPQPEPSLTPYQLNDLSEKTIEASAIDLRDAGFTTYAAALRGQCISSINVICRLNEPSLRSDLEIIRDYVDEMIHDLKHPRVA